VAKNANRHQRMLRNLCLEALDDDEAIPVPWQEMDLSSCCIPMTSVAVGPGL
jgi:hypothetical protein